ncbi:MAG TPA: YegS/Rv2252/BmrU family lipid kinase [Gemmatimonadaceae bacterium]|nr:YegS/Rv2252/BmrU family lipid kinase [Gemmatimonadaceae bacterium]
MRERTCVIVNPAAGRGRGARMFSEVESAFARIGGAQVRTTAAKGDEIAIARAAIADGCTTIVAVGGDGTTANVANAILHSGADVRLAVLPAGTGNDFSKVLGTSRADAATIAELCAQESSVRVDVGRVEDIFFVNCCGFGFDVAVLEQIGRIPWLKGRSLYLYTALRQLFRFRGINVAITSVNSERPATVHMLLAIANAAYFGGVFTIAPGASATDGSLEAVSILDIRPARRIAVLAAATRGTHMRYPQCSVERAPSFELMFDSPPSYEADGEVYRARTSVLRVISCPSALRVVTGPGFAASTKRQSNSE